MSKCLIVVDVQGQFEKGGYGKTLFDKNYIDRINQTIRRNKYDAVFFVYDCNSSEISIPAKFMKIENDFYTKRFFKNYAGYDIPSIEEYIEDGKGEVVDDEAYMIYEELYIKTYNAHETQHINDDLEGLVYEAGKYNEVFICGGADGECLEDIEHVLDYFKVPYKMKKNLVYPISFPGEMLDDCHWINIECPY